MSEGQMSGGGRAKVLYVEGAHVWEADIGDAMPAVSSVYTSMHTQRSAGLTAAIGEKPRHA